MNGQSKVCALVTTKSEVYTDPIGFKNGVCKGNLQAMQHSGVYTKWGIRVSFSFKQSNGSNNILRDLWVCGEFYFKTYKDYGSGKLCQNGFEMFCRKNLSENTGMKSDNYQRSIV